VLKGFLAETASTLLCMAAAVLACLLLKNWPNGVRLDTDQPPISPESMSANEISMVRRSLGR
jgi:hypothetical protein